VPVTEKSILFLFPTTRKIIPIVSFFGQGQGHGHGQGFILGKFRGIMPSKGNIISAMFLVAGTCIGGGMLALPVATGISGFVPSMVVMAACWLAMTLTALLLLEVSLWMEEGAHIITMTSRLLGAPGKIVSWILYLFICYASIVAYTAGGGVQIVNGAHALLGITIPKEIASIVFLLLFGAVIDFGSAVVGRVNSILFTAMIAAYIALITIGLDEVDPSQLTHRNWHPSLMAVPVMLTTFSFQTMVPSLTPYLKHHGKALRIAIIGGTTITFIAYAIWQWLILGIVPVEGEAGLAQAFALGEPPTQFLSSHVEGKWVSTIAEYFAFFAIGTSFLGIGLGLFDFLADGLHIKKEGWGKLILALLIIVPTIIFATQFERIFLVAMESSGGIGDSILNGIIPVLMVWIGRYHFGMSGEYRVFGGKPLLAGVFLFFFAALCVQIVAYLR
jgi:tyrosine-specific transport protein